MKKTFLKNLFRDIKNTFSRFLSIAIIIAVGVSFYAGVRSTSPDMKMSGDFYFDKNNFMDFKVVSTLGLTKDDLLEISKQKNVIRAEGSKSIDAVIEKNKHSLVMNVNSLPKKNGINDIHIVRGKRPINNNEAIIEERFFKENNLKLGDIIELKSGNDSNIGDNLNNNKFKIVGTAYSPLYISAQRQLSSIGNGSVKGFIYILPSVFKNDIYTEAYVICNNNKSKNSLLNNLNYKSTIKDVTENLKTLGIKRKDLRYKEVLRVANNKIKEAENNLNNSKKEAKDKFKDGYSKIENAFKNINKGRKELEEKQFLFNKKISDSEKQILNGKKQIQQGEEEINLKFKEIEKGKILLDISKNKLKNNEDKLNLSKQQTYRSIASSIKAKMEEIEENLHSEPNNQIYLDQYNFFTQIYEKSIKEKDFDSMYSSLKEEGTLNQINSYFNINELKNNFDKASYQINLGRHEIESKKILLENGEKKLETEKAKLQAYKGKVIKSESKLNEAKNQGIKQLNQAKIKLNASEKVVIKNLGKLKSEEKKANNKFKDAESKIEKNKKKISEIKKPDWYVLGRSDNVGYETYRQDSDRIDNIGKAFPLIFFLVASLVSLTTMTRMVQENRTEIGLFKALGYSRASIVTHYLVYSLAASLIGSIVGVLLGFRLFPTLIMNAYKSLYTIPNTISQFNTKLAIQSSLIAILFTTIASVAATLEELREIPAALMRPKPPKTGKNILIERIPFIWKRLNFTKKVTARNIFRYKQRFFMTVIGIAACTGLMITGFGLKAGIIGATENQFNKIYKYNMQVILTKDIDKEKNNMKNTIMKDSNIKSVLFTYSKNVKVQNGNTGNEDAYIVVPEKENELNNYINLVMNNKDLKLTDKGIIITEKLSKLIKKKAGDTFEITLNDKTIKVKISGITEQYVQHYIYMSPKYYEKVTGTKLKFNTFYGLLNNISDSSENNTSKILASINSIGSVSFKNNIHFDYNKSMKSVNSVVLVLIGAAGVLAFVVIYNLTNININERKRELATIKLLGFYDNELALYIYRENIILTIMGSLLGILIGILLNNFIIVTAETNIMMFLREINPIYFLYSIMLTILFSVIVNLVMYNRFNKIDMVESLKSAE